MNTKILMITSAVVMAIGGILLEFIPHEVLNYFGVPAAGMTPIFMQLIGAAYLGSAVMNWMAKAVLIGGIYARPLALGNFAHFVIGALALLRYAFVAPDSLIIWLLVVIYWLLAIGFGFVLFTHPLKTNSGVKN